MAYEVKFLMGTKEQYEAITPNDYTFYFLTDTDQIFLGDVQLSNVNVNDKINVINGELRGKANILMKSKEEWDEDLTLIGQANTFYIYTDRTTKEDEQGNIIEIPGIKIGDGLAYLVDLPFVDDLYFDHIHNKDIHVTLQDKAFWSNKLNIDDNEQVVDQTTLVFNRN